MPLLIWIIVALVCGAMFWLLARLFGQHGVSLWRAILAAFLVGLVSVCTDQFLEARIGDWHLLVAFVAAVVIVKAILQLSFLRALAVTILYLVLLTTIVYFVLIRPSKNRTPNERNKIALAGASAD